MTLDDLLLSWSMAKQDYIDCTKFVEHFKLEFAALTGSLIQLLRIIQNASNLRIN